MFFLLFLVFLEVRIKMYSKLFYRITIITFLSILLSSCFDVDICREGIDDYFISHADTILTYLTCRDGYPQGFIEKYEYKDSYYQYIRKGKGNTHFRKAFMRLTYDDDVYNQAISDVHSQDGFSDIDLCDYLGYSFHKNLYQRFSEVDFDPNLDNQYIDIINLIGENDITNSVVFVGFYYMVYADNDYNRMFEPVSYYPFSGWDKFFEDNFSDVDWGID